jgi:predicted nuclease of predicted toxin-antitoxin system
LKFGSSLDYTIVTQDSDFNDLNSLHGFPPKIIWIRTGNLRTQQIVDLLLKHSQEIEGFLENSKYGCFEIVSIKK